MSAANVDYWEQQRFNAAERAYLTPPDFDKAMESYDEYADNDAWFAAKELEWEAEREERILGYG